MEKNVFSKKNNTLLLILSAFFCGSAHIMCQRTVRGIVFLLWFFLSLGLAVFFFFFSPGEVQYLLGVVFAGLAVAGWVYTQIDIYEIFGEMKEEPPVPESKEHKTEFLGKPDENEKIEKEPAKEKPITVKQVTGSTKKTKGDELYKEGRLSYLRKDLKEAKMYFEKAAKLNKKDGDALFQLGRVCYDMGNREAAAKHFNAYLKLKTPDKRWKTDIKRYLDELEKK